VQRVRPAARLNRRPNREAIEAGPRARPHHVRMRVPRRPVRPSLIASLLVLLLVAAGTTAVAGHNGIIDVVITPPIVEPGDEITIQGGALWTELPVEVTLVHQDGGSRTIGSGMTAGDGSLFMTAVLPDDIPDGPYQVIVTNPYGESTHGSVVVRSAVQALPIALGVVALVVVGLGLMRWARRRPSTSASAPAAAPDPEA